QEQLKSAYQSKLAQVVNLEALRKQKIEVERRVAKLELQLPNRTEMDALLADVNHAGIARGLTFDLFRPQSAVVKPYYAEIPVSVKVN
ncbi:pilus assembly protein PilO, partial [Salmonella sp. gx-f9]|nr:pilus assembly protein PilO [Salmonella sp. gx-f9]